MSVKVKRVRDGARLPARASRGAAGFDLCACLDHDILSIACHQTVMVPTGLAMEIPLGFFGALFARSGLSSKRGLRPANCVGVIDPDYRGEIMVALHNDTDTNQFIENGQRIAQLLIMPYVTVDYIETDVLSDTSRGEGGFGSTGSGTGKEN